MNSGSASSSPARSTTAGGTANPSGTAAGDFHIPSELMCIHDRKDQALRVLKSDLMAALNKEVKSLDEDNWMFEGPRSRINLLSKQGGFLPRQMDHSDRDLSSTKIGRWR